MWFILMREVKTEWIASHIIAAGNIVSGTLDYLQNVVSEHPDVDPSYITKRLSVSYMMRDYSKHERGHHESLITAVRDLIKVTRTIYDRTGMLVGADWGNNRNVGETPKGRPSPYDFGRSNYHSSSNNFTRYEHTKIVI